MRSWSEYLEYDREGKEGDPSLVGGFTSLIRLLLDRMGVLHCDRKYNCYVNCKDNIAGQVDNEDKL